MAAGVEAVIVQPNNPVVDLSGRLAPTVVFEIPTKRMGVIDLEPFGLSLPKLPKITGWSWNLLCWAI